MGFLCCFAGEGFRRRQFAEQLEIYKKEEKK